MEAPRPEYRYEPLRAEWVIVSPGRASRPRFSAKGEILSTSSSEAACPFCPGHERATPPEVYAVVAFFSHSMKGSRGGSVWSFGNNIGLVRIEGGIYKSQEIIEQLDEYRKDGSIKAIVIRINSPGGSVATSQEIYRASKKAAEKKPVIASMETVAASGGYYAALGATKIFANPGTITGSIGVRLEHVMLKDLLEWAKIHYETLKSGKFKDIGSFDHKLTAEERKLLQTLLDDIHTQFKEAVMRERKLSKEDVDKIADGRVFTGREAYEAKLVDELGGFVEVIEMAKELAGIKGEPRIVEKKKFKYEWLSEAWESAIDLLWRAVVTRSVDQPMRLPVYKTSQF